MLVQPSDEEPLLFDPLLQISFVLRVGRVCHDTQALRAASPSQQINAYPTALVPPVGLGRLELPAALCRHWLWRRHPVVIKCERQIGSARRRAYVSPDVARRNTDGLQPFNGRGSQAMDRKASQSEHQQPDLWTWMVVGVIYAGVMVALWETSRGLSGSSFAICGQPSVRGRVWAAPLQLNEEEARRAARQAPSAPVPSLQRFTQASGHPTARRTWGAGLLSGAP